jgi:hypothetical protein
MAFRANLLQRWLVAALVLLGLVVSGGAWAQAQPVKVAPDLSLVLARSDLSPGWVRTVGGTRYVKVLIMARSTDTSLASLRAQVLASGGGVYYRFISMQGLSATLPASAVATIAARSDVLYVVPNRPAMRLQSVLQRASGQADLAASLGTAAGVDGAGVGIAVLDSGIDFRHANFRRPDGSSRVAGAVDFVSMRKNFVDGGWRVGSDYSPSTTASIDGTKYWQDGPQLAPKANNPDPYGHGSIVAGMAAGSGAYQSPNSSGIATGATLWDVRVLDERGLGEMADVLAGVDWVTQRARLAGIRVMNVSLGVTAWESYLIDPLARAVRGATATGVTVVAAAGNRGAGARSVGDHGGGRQPQGHRSAQRRRRHALQRQGPDSRQAGLPERRGAHRQPGQARPRGTRQPPGGRARLRQVPERVWLERAGARLPGPDTSERGDAAVRPGAHAAQRHIDRFASGGRSCCAHAAGQPWAHAAAREGDLAVHGAASV